MGSHMTLSGENHENVKGKVGQFLGMSTTT